MILFIEATSDFAVSRSLGHRDESKLGDQRSALKWPWREVSFGIDQVHSQTKSFLFVISYDY